MTDPKKRGGFAQLAAFAFIGWLGMLVHNVVDLPGLTPLSPENSLPVLVGALLVGACWLLPNKRAAEAALLVWALLHLVVGGILSGLPLPIWPFAPAQTPLHYAMHLLYGTAQLPLIWLLLHRMRWETHTRARGTSPTRAGGAVAAWRVTPGGEHVDAEGGER